MEKINNSTAYLNFRESTQVQSLLSDLSVKTEVMPVIDITPQVKILTTNVVNSTFTQATASGQTVISADPDNDIYITGMNMTLSKDATSDLTSIAVSCYPSDTPAAFRQLMQARLLTLTALQGYYASQNLAFPLKITRNTAVTLSITQTNVGTVTGSVQIFYYKVYNAKG